jgi:hypothetical protein
MRPGKLTWLAGRLTTHVIGIPGMTERAIFGCCVRCLLAVVKTSRVGDSRSFA